MGRHDNYDLRGGWLGVKTHYLSIYYYQGRQVKLLTTRWVATIIMTFAAVDWALKPIIYLSTTTRGVGGQKCFSLKMSGTLLRGSGGCPPGNVFNLEINSVLSGAPKRL